MIGSTVASGAVRVKKAKNEMALMDQQNSDVLSCPKPGGDGLPKATKRVTTCEDLRMQIRKAADELENAIALHGLLRGFANNFETA